MPWTYLGGSLLEDPNWIARAHQLARGVIQSFPGTRGYFGIDLILGSTESEDVILELGRCVSACPSALFACQCRHPWLGSGVAHLYHQSPKVVFAEKAQNVAGVAV